MKLKQIVAGIARQKVKIIAAVLVAAIVVSGTYFATSGMFSTQSNTAMSNNLYMEEIVAVGDIVVGITESATTVLNTTSISYAFESEVIEVYVKTGQYVTAGEQIAKIDTDEVTDSYEDLQDELTAARLTLSNTLIDAELDKIAAEEVYNTSIYTGENSVALYQLEIKDLESDYSSLVSDIATLTAQIESLNAEIDALDDKYDTASMQASCTVLEIEIATLTEQLTHAQGCDGTVTIYKDASGNVVDGAVVDGTTATTTCTVQSSHDVVALTSSITSKQNELDELYEDIEDAPTDYATELASLESQIESAESSLTTKENSRDSYLSTIDAETAQAYASYEENMSSYNNAETIYNNTIAAINTKIADAQETVDDLLEDIATQEALLMDGLVLAPCDGYIMTIAEEEDTLYVNGTIAIIAEREIVNLTVSIDQEDISDISVGMETIVLFDAYDDMPLDAEVDTVSITSSSAMSSSVSYTVNVECDINPLEDLVVYQGMTADVTFVQNQVKDVLIVSNKCISSENGKEYVQLLDASGEIVLTQVTTGFSDGFDVEIVSGLVEGDIVIIESAVTTSAN